MHKIFFSLMCVDCSTHVSNRESSAFLWSFFEFSHTVTGTMKIHVHSFHVRSSILISLWSKLWQSQTDTEFIFLLSYSDELNNFYFYDDEHVTFIPFFSSRRIQLNRSFFSCTYHLQLWDPSVFVTMTHPLLTIRLFLPSMRRCLTTLTHWICIVSIR